MATLHVSAYGAYGTGLTAGTEYAFAIHCNYTAVGTAQAQALIRVCVGTPTSGTGIVGSVATTRYDIPPSVGWDTKTNDTLLAGGNVRQWYGPSGQQHSFIPTGNKMVLEYSSNTVDTNDVVMSVFQNGSLVTSFDPATTGLILFSADITITPGQRVDIVAGMRWSESSPADGSRLRAVHVNDSVTTKRVKPPTKQIVVLGDSIACGYYGNPASQYGYFEVMRRSMQTPIALETFSGHTLYNIAKDAGTISTTVALLADYGIGSNIGTVVIHALGTNDFGLNTMSASIYGTDLAALSTAITTADSTVVQIFQTMIHRADEATPNGSGNILADYNSQMVSVQSTVSGSKLVNGQTQLLTTTPTGPGSVHPVAAEMATMASNYIPILRGFGIS